MLKISSLAIALLLTSTSAYAYKLPAPTVYCDSIGDEHGSNLSVDAGDRLKSLLPKLALPYESDCVMSSYIAAECRTHPKMSINQAIDSLVSKANGGKKLPDIPRCGA